MRAVTFDCWSTLIFEHDPAAAVALRVEALVRAAADLGIEVESPGARAALNAAWRRHLVLWQRGIASGAPEMAAWALEELGSGQGSAEEAAVLRLAEEFARATLTTEIQVLPLEGARTTLERLREAGLRRALVCDTGFSPGRVVRVLLERAGLLELLEVQIFSDEAGVPKPHPRVFAAALAELGAEPSVAVHVGDLRRTDVAGARAAGMRTVRLRGHHDDRSELPDADAVAESHRHLRQILGVE